MFHTAGYNIGNVTNRYGTVYTQNIDVSGNIIGNTFSGVAGSANKLTNILSLQITGDVNSTNTVQFDGSAGTGQGLNSVITTELSSTFVQDKTNINAAYVGGKILDTDELLINRPQANTDPLDPTAYGLYKITYSDMLATVPQLPIGMIVPFAG